jgi:hypothetical protein
MKVAMLPLLLPVGIFGFLGGAALGASRKNLSMLPPRRRALGGVPTVAWERFVTIMAIAPREHVSPRRRFGMFGMDARRLADVGFMTTPHKSTIGGESGVWSGEWVAPLTEQKFLASTPAQYEALTRSMRRLVPAAQPHVGKSIDGKRATLSGLLAAGHLAGEAGLGSWVADPAVRKKFGATTAKFDKANGIF